MSGSDETTKVTTRCVSTSRQGPGLKRIEVPNAPIRPARMVTVNVLPEFEQKLRATLDFQRRYFGIFVMFFILSTLALIVGAVLDSPLVMGLAAAIVGLTLAILPFSTLTTSIPVKFFGRIIGLCQGIVATRIVGALFLVAGVATLIRTL